MNLQQWQQKMQNLQTQAQNSFQPELDKKIGQTMLTFFLSNFDKGGYEPNQSVIPWAERKYNLDHKALNKTGQLRASFRVSKASNGTIELLNDAPYAQYIQEGTDKMPARPLLYESDDLNAQITSMLLKEFGELFNFN